MIVGAAIVYTTLFMKRNFDGPSVAAEPIPYIQGKAVTA
jgi:hypothetical protein